MNFSTAHNVIDNRIQRNPGNSLGFIILDFKSNQKRKLIKHTSEARINKIDQDFIRIVKIFGNLYLYLNKD